MGSLITKSIEVTSWSLWEHFRHMKGTVDHFGVALGHFRGTWGQFNLIRMTGITLGPLLGSLWGYTM